MGNATGKNASLIKDYVANSRSLTKSQDQRYVEKLFKHYDKKGKGYLNKDEAQRFIDDALAVSGLKTKIMEKAEGDQAAFYKAEVDTIYKEIDSDGKGKIEIQDIVKPGLHTLHDLLDQVHTKPLERGSDDGIGSGTSRPALDVPTKTGSKGSGIGTDKKENKGGKKRKLVVMPHSTLPITAKPLVTTLYCIEAYMVTIGILSKVFESGPSNSGRFHRGRRAAQSPVELSRFQTTSSFQLVCWPS